MGDIMLSKTNIETVPENEVPSGRGRPGPTLPTWLLENVAKSAEAGVWLSAKFKTPEEAEELAKALQYVNRSTRFAYHVATRRDESTEGHRVLFKAEVQQGENNG
ncbi:hypothetical protein EYS09_21610 [Streptomyces kasugaensis]|uniref:Uncharacterized protein n=1 Tax=Streptomyces kasugaensis TaxID=1946 RepID=A0A4Q9HTY2_STRKA|nr:hypothetical protein [Streptomyces kasugaensis]TBO57640.1 hypothetical protein EYS09_21610 [Streptomyces kasugaensis]